MKTRRLHAILRRARMNATVLAAATTLATVMSIMMGVVMTPLPPRPS